MTRQIYRALGSDLEFPRVDEATVNQLRDENADLLAAGILDAGDPAAWPTADRDRLAARRRHAIARELIESSVLVALLDGLARDGVRCLILKGAAVARTHYAQSWWRLRSDIDLLIPAAGLAVAERALAQSDWTPVLEPKGLLASGQRHFVHRLGAAPPLDVHVRLLAPVLEPLPSFAELWTGKRVVPRLGAAAWTLADSDALWYGCTHIALHHTGDASALWLYDLDRIARGLTSAGWEAFAGRASATRTRGVCATVLDGAAGMFGTPIPHTVGEWRSLRNEPSARFLRARSELHIQWLNLRALPGWRARVEWVRAHALPDPSYIRARYRVSTRPGLVAAYAHRAAAGTVKWFGLAVAGKR